MGRVVKFALLFLFSLFFYFFCFPHAFQAVAVGFTPTFPRSVQRSMRENPGNLLAYPVITSIMLRGVLASRLRAVYAQSPGSSGVREFGSQAVRNSRLRERVNPVHVHVHVHVLVLRNDTVAISVRLFQCVCVLLLARTKH